MKLINVQRIQQSALLLSRLKKNPVEPVIILERAMDAISQIMVETSNSGGSYRIYDPSEHANSDDHALAESLVDAITNNRFDLSFQPIYDINNDRSDFFEVYLRLPLSDADNTVLTLINLWRWLKKTSTVRKD